MSTRLEAEFRHYLEQEGKSSATIIAYAKDVSQLLEIIPVDKLKNATEILLSQAIDKLTQQYALSPKTISRKLNSFRVFFRFLALQGKVVGNAAEKVAHPRYTQKPPRILSQPELLALREVSRGNPRLYTMIELLKQTGIRIGELARLTVGDVHLSAPLPYISICGFSSVPAREVPLNERAQKELKTYMQGQKDLSDNNHPLFATRDGKHIAIRNIRSSIDRAMHKAGITDACVNDLRNTFVVSQLRAGTPIDLVGQIVGHRSKVTTSKYLSMLGKDYSPNGITKLAVV